MMDAPTRREVVSSLGSLAIGGTVGAVALQETTGRASADVTMGELSMQGTDMTTDNGTVQRVTASVSGSWQYELPAGDPEAWRVSLRVSDGDSWYTVGETGQTVKYAQYNDDYSVSGSVTDTDAFDPEFFAPPGPGQQTVVDLPFQVWFRVVSTSDTLLADTTVSDVATITITQNQINASEYGQVGGSGSVTVE